MKQQPGMSIWTMDNTYHEEPERTKAVQRRNEDFYNKRLSARKRFKEGQSGMGTPTMYWEDNFKNTRYSTNHGLVHTESSKRYQIRCRYRVQLMGRRKRKVVHFNRLKLCFDQQKLLLIVVYYILSQMYVNCNTFTKTGRYVKISQISILLCYIMQALSLRLLQVVERINFNYI